MRKDIWIRIERGENNCSAYAPAVPGCISTGRTIEDARKNMEEALAFHLEGMLEDGASLDGIASGFPEGAAHAPAGEDEYFALAHIEVARAMAGAEA